MLKAALAAIITLLVSATLHAATIDIEKVWLEHGVVINGKSALKVHCKFKTHGLKDKKCHMNIWLFDANKKIHHVNSQYKSIQGDTYFAYSFCPSYDNATYDDYWYAPYIADLNIEPGKDYHVLVTLSCGSDCLAQSQWLPFSATGGNNRSNSGNSNSSSVTRTFYTTVGYGCNGAVWVGEGREDKKMQARFSGNTVHLSGTGLLKDGRTFTYVSTNDKGESLYRSEKTLPSTGWKDIMELRVDKSKTHASIANQLNGSWTSTEYWVTDLTERRRIISQNRAGIRSGSAPTGTNSATSPSSTRHDNTDNSRHRDSNASRYGHYDCPTCYGTGTCQTCGGSGIASSYTAGGMNCPNCYGNYTHRRADWGRCSVCKGTGKKYGVVR